MQKMWKGKRVSYFMRQIAAKRLTSLYKRSNLLTQQVPLKLELG